LLRPSLKAGPDEKEMPETRPGSCFQQLPAATIRTILPKRSSACSSRHMNEYLSRAIADRVDDLVALTIDLIRFPTVNPPGEAYTPCAKYIAARLKKQGFETILIRGEDTPGDNDRYPRTNVIARREGRRPGPTVHFNSHIDVVEAGAGWTVDPFKGVVRDGKVYGRGACDMKGGLAASIIAAEAFIAVNPAFSCAIEISGTVDEESGGFGGVAYLAQK